MKLNWNVDSSWTLFIDRDGVINERNFDGYILDKESFVFKKGVLEVSESLFSKFKYVVVVTNQQCIGKGLITTAQLNDIHDYMNNCFVQNNANIDMILVAPEIKGSQSHLRKPSPQMAYQAKDKLKDIDFSKSIMIGDTDTDIEFGKNLEMKTVLIESREKCFANPDIKVSSLTELNQLLS